MIVNTTPIIKDGVDETGIEAGLLNAKNISKINLLVLFKTLKKKFIKARNAIQKSKLIRR